MTAMKNPSVPWLCGVSNSVSVSACALMMYGRAVNMMASAKLLPGPTSSITFSCPAGEIANKRRSVGRCQHDVVATDLHRLRRVARQLGELLRRSCAQRLHVPGVEVNRDAVNRGPRILEQLQRLGVVANLDADVGQDPIGVGLDQGKTLLVQEFVWRDLAADERWRVGPGTLTSSGRHPCRPPAARAMTCSRVGVGHVVTFLRWSSTSWSAGMWQRIWWPLPASSMGGSVTSQTPSMNR